MNQTQDRSRLMEAFCAGDIPRLEFYNMVVPSIEWLVNFISNNEAPPKLLLSNLQQGQYVQIRMYFGVNDDDLDSVLMNIPTGTEVDKSVAMSFVEVLELAEQERQLCLKV